jgi:response regulator RpfG family c-di-GMP phosphodiesterase
MNNRILLVDDDLDILSGFQRNLRKHFTIKTAASGQEALAIIRENPPFAAVVSDYSMPKMNGIEFLGAVKKASPDTVRVMLTGFADLETSITAVNQGNVFRFLTKPVNTDNLIATINDCVEQHRLVTSEKELLDKTLKGAVKILIDILSTMNPAAFNQAAKIRSVARSIADQLAMKNVWEVEIAALLSHIGCVTVPGEIIEKVNNNEPLNETEDKMYKNHPLLGEQLLKNIPRFDKISESIRYQNYSYDGTYPPESKVKGDDLPFIARILKASFDFSRYVKMGYTERQAINKMKPDSFQYDPKVFTALMTINNMTNNGYVIKSIPFRSLRIGMILAEDLKDEEQFVLISKGQEITDVMLLRLINLSRIKTIVEPIRVVELSRETY